MNRSCFVLVLQQGRFPAPLPPQGCSMATALGVWATRLEGKCSVKRRGACGLLRSGRRWV